MIPNSYSEWKYCIEVKCGIKLTEDFIKSRIHTLSDRNHDETKKFITTYDENHLNRVVEWYKKSLTEIS
jgi:hypothetical protein